MLKSLKRIVKTKQLPPGTLVHVGEKKIDTPRISVIDFCDKEFDEKQLAGIDELLKYKMKKKVSWINIDGIHDIDIIERIGKHFNFHPLMLEDILNTTQRPKYDDYEKYLFFVLKMLTYNSEVNEVETEQVSLILGKDFVISFQEKQGDVFDPVRERIRNNKGRIRKSGADYMAYSLMDSIVDNYYVIIEKVGDKIESIEEEMIKDPATETLRSIHKLKNDMIFLRKSVWPLREAISSLERRESGLIQESTQVFLRDLYDHIIQIIDTVETYRDLLSGMIEMYLSIISNKMNEIMKVLTIIATIFIPITFIAGIYGMNFKYMPELNWRWGYLGVWIVILTVVVFMLNYFRKKKWL